MFWWFFSLDATPYQKSLSIFALKRERTFIKDIFASRRRAQVTDPSFGFLHFCVFFNKDILCY